MENTKRKDGFYWIRTVISSEWDIGRYDSDQKLFILCFAVFPESSVLEIDEEMITRDELKVDDEVLIEPDDSSVGGKGTVVDKITVYLIEDKDGETHAYGEIGNWSIFEVKDLDNVEKV